MIDRERFPVYFLLSSVKFPFWVLTEPITQPHPLFNKTISKQEIDVVTKLASSGKVKSISRLSINHPFKEASLYQIKEGDLLLGYLLVHSQQTNSVDGLASQLTDIFAYVYKSYRIINEKNQKYKKQFMYGVLYNNFESYSLMLQQGKLWDMDFSIPVQIIVIDFPKSLSVNEDKLTAAMKRLENLPLDFLVQTSGILLMDKLVMFFFIERNKNRNN